MFKKINLLYKKYEEIINYLIFGVLSTLVSIVSYTIFTRLFNINYNISNILSWILAVTFAFITNKNYVFKSKNTNYLKDLIKFFTSRVSTLIIEIIVMYLLVDILDLNDLFSKIITQFIVIVLNYILSKLFVFKTKKDKTNLV